MYNRVRRVGNAHAKIFGVCAGLSKYIDPEADPMIMRLIWVFLALFSGGFPVVFIYLILALVLRKEDTIIVEDKNKEYIK